MQDQTLLVKIDKYVGFCVYRRSYLIWPPVIFFPRAREQLTTAVASVPSPARGPTSIIARGAPLSIFSIFGTRCK